MGVERVGQEIIETFRRRSRQKANVRFAFMLS